MSIDSGGRTPASRSLNTHAVAGLPKNGAKCSGSGKQIASGDSGADVTSGPVRVSVHPFAHLHVDDGDGDVNAALGGTSHALDLVNNCAV
jgi:hypothetical protein